MARINKPADIGEQVIVALRRVILAADLYWRNLAVRHGQTGPRALPLKALQNVKLPAGELAARVSLSQGTVTDILNRLGKRGLVSGIRDTADRAGARGSRGVAAPAAGVLCAASLRTRGVGADRARTFHPVAAKSRQVFVVWVNAANSSKVQTVTVLR